MGNIKEKAQGIPANLRARDIQEMTKDTENIYATLNVISKRARQLSNDLKRELNAKLDEFAVTVDTIEEITENKEQIEISKFYEKLPNPAIIATQEFLEEKLEVRFNQKEEDEGDLELE